jgi:hypothetical protein
MDMAISKLLAISSNAAAEPMRDTGEMVQYLAKWGARGNELASLLKKRNGFFAYESSLLVRPFGSLSPPLGLREWNAHDLWNSAYEEHLEDILFFSEDAFGGQFCIHTEKIWTFDPETGELEEVSASLDAWAALLMKDYNYRTGYSLAHSWQLKHGPLKSGVRLLPKLPFVLGGKYEISNLYPVEDVKGMLFRAQIANQIRGVPDGGEVTIEFVNKKRPAQAQQTKETDKTDEAG